ncbi:MAG: hypothetical protein OER96_09505 [Gammaproteobacteria bacterium]|nr:hypothetical protein [Gammaproteobacteria bacterium]
MNTLIVTKGKTFVFCVTRVVITVLAAQLTSLAVAQQAGQTPSVSLGSMDELSKRMQAAVVYQRDDGIYKTEIGNTQAALIVKNGRYPRWSPDGRYIAFIKSNGIGRVKADGSKLELLVKAKKPNAVAYHPNGNEILFIDGDTIFSVAINSRQVRRVAKGHRFQELDIIENGARLAVTIKELFGGFGVYGFDLRANTQHRLGNGCSAGMPPSGKWVSNLVDGHKKLNLIDWKTGETRLVIDAPPGEKFDNQAWSNKEDWLVSESEVNGHNIYMHEVSANRATQVTGGGKDQRPDLYIYQLY